MPRARKKKPPLSTFYHDVGRNIRLARSAAGKTLKDIAGHINVSTQQFQKYEKGINRIPLEDLVSVASYLEVSVSQLIGDTASPAANSALQRLIDETSTRDVQILLKSFGAIKEPGARAALLQYMKAMASLEALCG